MKKYLLFIFDWQDTLINTRSGKLFTGVKELLAELRKNNAKLGIATGSSRPAFETLLELLGMEKVFDYTKTSSECALKPDPDMLNQILSEAGIDKENAVMVGDTIQDIIMAKNAGIDSIALVQGSDNKAALANMHSTYLFDNINDLYNAIISSGRYLAS